MPTQKDLLGVRNSRMFLNEVYFWTDTVHNWKRLLRPDVYKLLLIEYLQKLVALAKWSCTVTSSCPITCT